MDDMKPGDTGGGVGLGNWEFDANSARIATLNAERDELRDHADVLEANYCRVEAERDELTRRLAAADAARARAVETRENANAATLRAEVERDASKAENERLRRIVDSVQSKTALDIVVEKMAAEDARTAAKAERDEAIRERDAARGVLTQAVRELGDWRDGSEVMRDELVDDFLEAARAALPEIAGGPATQEDKEDKMASDEPDHWIERVQEVVDEAHAKNWGGEHREGFCKACANAYLVAQHAVPRADEARQQRDELLEAIEAAENACDAFGVRTVASIAALYDTAKRIRRETGDAE